MTSETRLAEAVALLREAKAAQTVIVGEIRSTLISQQEVNRLAAEFFGNWMPGVNTFLRSLDAAPAEPVAEAWHVHEWAYTGDGAARAKQVYGRESGRAVCACGDRSHVESMWVIPDVFFDVDLEAIIADHNARQPAPTEGRS